MYVCVNEHAHVFFVLVVCACLCTSCGVCRLVVGACRSVGSACSLSHDGFVVLRFTSKVDADVEDMAFLLRTSLQKLFLVQCYADAQVGTPLCVLLDVCLHVRLSLPSRFLDWWWCW